MRDEIIYPFPNFNGATIDVLGWIRIFHQHLIRHVIIYACLDKSWSILVRGAPDKT